MKVEIYGKPWCPYCDAAKSLAELNDCNYVYKSLDEDFSKETFLDLFPGALTFPQIIVDGAKIGGYTEFRVFIDSTKEEI